MRHEPLLLVPPMLCDARVFSPQINALSLNGAVMFAPTTCGERAEEIASAILSWAPPKFALVGMAMGGVISLEIVRRAPERVTRLALLNSGFQGETPQGASAREPLIVAARSGRFGDVIPKEIDPAGLTASPERGRLMQLVTDMAEAVGPEGYVQQARAMQRRRDQQSTLRRITQPTMILGGEDEIIFPVKRQEFMAELIHGARLEIIAGAGHLPTLEQPNATTQAIWDWMRQPLYLR